MIDYINLGPTPAGEDCAQLGDDNYKVNAMSECYRYIKLLKDKFGEPPTGAELVVKAFYHDFGTYHEVVCYYNDHYEVAPEYCYYLEANAPEYWEDD
jgi:hypothetical protein